MDLIDALTVAGHVDSPMVLSEEGPFRRKFSAVYDALQGHIRSFHEHPDQRHGHRQPGDRATAVTLRPISRGGNLPYLFVSPPLWGRPSLG